MEIIIARHGETDYNVKGLVQGQKQSKLTKNGIRQAKALAERLKNKKIDFLYTSKLIRAINTAKIINKFHNLKINKVKELNERKFGVFEDKKGDDMRKKFSTNITEDINFKPKGAESWKDLNKRAVSFIKSLIKLSNPKDSKGFGNSKNFQSKHKEKTILIVAHKGVNRLILNHFLKKPLENHDKIKQDPASINIVKIEGKKIKVKVNDIRHLKGIKIIKELKHVV